MGNEFSAKVFAKPVLDELNAIDRRVDRATMWALRETGRKTKAAAKRKAPVWQGNRKHTTWDGRHILINQRSNALHIRDVKSMRKLGMINAQTGLVEGEDSNTIVVGLLKDSIATSRRLKKVGDTYMLKVGPWGPRVFKYRRKIEAIKPYMAPAYDEVVPQMIGIHSRAWARANERK